METMKPLKDELQDNITAALGVPIDDILDIQLEELDSRPGVKVKFTIKNFDEEDEIVDICIISKRKLKANFLLPNMDLETMEPIKDELRDNMSAFLGVYIDDILDVQLEEIDPGPGVKVSFTIKHSPEDVARMSNLDVTNNLMEKLKKITITKILKKQSIKIFPFFFVLTKQNF